MASVFDGVPQFSLLDLKPAVAAYNTGRDNVRQDQALGMQQQSLAFQQQQAVQAAAAAEKARAEAGTRADRQFSLEQAKAISEAVRQGALGADTPEKWDGYINVLEKHFGKKLSPELRDFKTRDAYLDPTKANGAYGVSPLYGRDPSGNDVVLQIGPQGKGVVTQFPDGIRPYGPQELSQNRAYGTELGKTGAGAQAQLGPAIIDAERTIQQVNDLIKAPGLGGITGGPLGLAVNQFKPSWQMSTDENDALTRLNQLQGGAFLEARKLLRGGGQITDFEGKKAEQAMSRMNRALSKEAFVEALNDFNEAVKSGIAKLQTVANQGNQPTAAPAAPLANPPRVITAPGGGPVFDWAPGAGLRPVQ